MSYLKFISSLGVASLALLGAVYLSTSAAAPSNQPVADASAPALNTTSEEPAPQVTSTLDESLTVPNSDSFDSDPQRPFLVSLVLSLGRLPRDGERQKLLLKYVYDKQPYPGWALAVKRIGTDFRPEVYWQDEKGNGGWFTFDSYSVVEEGRYALTFILEEGKLLVGYIEELSRQGSPDDTRQTERKATFIGGYDISVVGPVKTQADLRVGASTGRKGARNPISEVLLAKLDQSLASRESYMQLVEGGPSNIKTRIKDSEVKLYIKDGKGTLSDMPTSAKENK